MDYHRPRWITIDVAAAAAAEQQQQLLPPSLDSFHFLLLLCPYATDYSFSFWQYRRGSTA